MWILQIKGDISESFWKIWKSKFSKILFLPLSEVTKISERLYKKL